ALIQMTWPLVYRIAALVILVANAVYVECRPTVPCRLRLEPKGRMTVLVDSAWVQANKVQSFLIHPWLTAFSAEFPNGDIQYWWVFADSASADDFRRLRVWLQWESHPVSAPLVARTPKI
ncbi:MAG: hypothetical protein RIR18_2003, partial [Pseudomonadota bacterium]